MKASSESGATNSASVEGDFFTGTPTLNPNTYCSVFTSRDVDQSRGSGVSSLINLKVL